MHCDHIIRVTRRGENRVRVGCVDPGGDQPFARQIQPTDISILVEVAQCVVKDGATISFGVGDLSVIDYDTGFVLDQDPEEVRAVLEVANVQLLEMRYLDQELDQALQRSYALLSRQGGWKSLAPAAYASEPITPTTRPRRCCGARVCIT